MNLSSICDINLTFTTATGDTTGMGSWEKNHLLETLLTVCILTGTNLDLVCAT